MWNHQVCREVHVYICSGRWEGGNCVGGAIVWRTAQWDGGGETAPDSTLLPFTAIWCQVDKIHVHNPTTSHPPNKANVSRVSTLPQVASIGN